MSLLEDIDNMLALFKISSTFIQQCARKSLPPCSSSSANAVNVITDTIPHWEQVGFGAVRLWVENVYSLLTIWLKWSKQERYHQTMTANPNKLRMVWKFVEQDIPSNKALVFQAMCTILTNPEDSRKIPTCRCWNRSRVPACRWWPIWDSQPLASSKGNKISVVNFLRLSRLVPCVKISVRIEMCPRIWANTFLDM